jgi:hypothetical protein
MKTITLNLLISFILFGFGVSSNAQEGYRITTERFVIHEMDSMVYVLEVDRAKDKDVSRQWEKSIERNKVKATVDQNKVDVIGVVIKDVGADSLDMYTETVQQDSSIKMYVLVFANHEWLDPEIMEGNSIKVRNVIENFGREIYKGVLEEELEDKQKALKDLTKAREMNLKNQDNILKSIQSDSLGIQKMENEIAMLNTQLVDANRDYNSQKSKIATTKYPDKDAEKAAKAELKGMDSHRKDIEKQIKKDNNEIIDLQSRIRENWYQKEQLQKKLNQLEESLRVQRIIVEQATEELESYK